MRKFGRAGLVYWVNEPPKKTRIFKPQRHRARVFMTASHDVAELPPGN